MVALAAFVGLPVVGCGGEDSEADPGGGSCSSGLSSQIALNHGHALSVPAADVEHGVDRTYDVQGTSLHTHSITVTAADFARLANGESVVVKTGEGAAHTHDVTITCA